MPKLRIVPIILLALLLLFPAWSIQGAASGILLWFQVVLPTLAPFIICTQMVMAFDAVELLVKPFKRLFRFCFGLSDNGTYILICGLLCGYPLGAKLCADFLHYRKISRTEADYLLSMCNHPSPMFLLGFVMNQLPVTVPAAFLLACLYLPVLPVSLLSRRFYRLPENGEAKSKTMLAGCSIAAETSDNKPSRPSLEDILLSTCETMVVIGGYIMLFSILAVWILQVNVLSPQIKSLLTGIAEITTGVNQICQTVPAAECLPMVIGVVAFGGLSGIFQTRSVIKNAGLSIRHYVSWKIIHTCFSCLIFILLSLLLPLRS